MTLDGTAEPVSRDQILRRERVQGNAHFLCSADHVQDWQPYTRLVYTLATGIHLYRLPRRPSSYGSNTSALTLMQTSCVSLLSSLNHRRTCSPVGVVMTHPSDENKENTSRREHNNQKPLLDWLVKHTARTRQDGKSGIPINQSSPTHIRIMHMLTTYCPTFL